MRLRRPNWQNLLISAIIAVCLVAMVYALESAVTGTEGYKLPEAVEQVDPVPAAVRVPSQTRVFADLLPGYTGVLVIDGLELETINIEDLQDKSKPGKQITLPPTTIFEPGNATLTFVPSDDAPVKEFTQGEHTVQVIYWKVTEGRGAASAYSWTFNVF